jgi:hypothetical protein
MQPAESSRSLRKALEYDAARRRVWLFGQRCHHGATGALIATIAALGLAAHAKPRSVATLAATGGFLMAHDWRDRSIWFERGSQFQV